MPAIGFITVIGCKKCGKCDTVCPNGALIRMDGFPVIFHEKCDMCMRCIAACPNRSLKILE